MKTKTLLIAAAALAAGVVSSQAQVYSQNIVGYVNTAIPGNNALTLINNPLVGPNGTNGASQVLTGLNQASGGESLYVWTGSGYYVYTYQGAGVGTGLGFASDFTDPNGGAAGAIPGDVFDGANGVWWVAAPPQLKQGQGIFIQNPNVLETNTFVGTVVLQNTNTPVAITGNNSLSLVASTVPVGGALTNSVFNLPFNAASGGESVFIWTGSGYHVYTYQGAGVGTGLGFASDYTDPNGGAAGAIPGDVFDGANGVWWVSAPPAVTVGQGFFVQNPNTTESWTQNLNVQ